MKNIITNKKIMLGVLTMTLVFAIIIVSSFFPFILDPSRINTCEFFTDQMIIYAIILSATISMLFVAQSSNASNEKSEVAKAKVAFAKSITNITNYTAFFQWVKNVLQVNDRKDILERGLLKLNVSSKVLNLTDEEIKTLTKPQKIDGVFYKALNEKQIQNVIALRKKVNSIKFVSPNYYVSYQNFVSEKNLSEIANKETAKKVSTVAVQLVSKLTSSLIGAIILGSLVLDLTQSTPEMIASCIMTFLSRSFAFFSSSFTGYLLGCKINDLDAFYILKRVEVHRLYLEDKKFVPVDEEKEAFKERIKEENKLLLEDTKNE